MASTRPRTRDVYTVMYGPCTRPCTRHVYGRVRMSTCTRAVYTAVYGPSTRPKTAVYTAVHGRVTCRVYGRVWAVPPRVHGSVWAVCTAVFGRGHWPCTLPFSAVYISRTRPCNGPCSRPCTRAVWAVYTACRPTGPCKRSQTARYGRVRPVTAYGPCTRPCTRPV